jgi:hypothetical protein
MSPHHLILEIANFLQSHKEKTLTSQEAELVKAVEATVESDKAKYVAISPKADSADIKIGVQTTTRRQRQSIISSTYIYHELHAIPCHLLV